MPDYPLKLYLEKLKLWYRVYDGPDEAVGPLIAGRSSGQAQKLATSLKLPRPDGNFDYGDAALVRLSVDEVRDPTDPNIILQHHVPSGVQALAHALREAFGQTDQELTTSSLDAFFNLKRGRMSLQEYTAEWELRYEEAQTVAKTYLYFQHSGLSNRFIEDVKLQIHSDMSRFQEARRLALRLNARQGEPAVNSTDLYGDVHEEFYDADPYHDQTFYQDWNGWPYSAWEDQYSYYDQLDTWYEEDEGDPWSGDSWPSESAWPQAEEYTIHDEEEYQTASSSSPIQEPDAAAVNSTEDYYQKGKGSGGFFVCGSRWHMAAQCPVNTSGKSKGKGKSFDSHGKSSRPWHPKGRGKGYGKSYGKYNKGKSFGKGKGFGKNRKGFGKGKYKQGLFSDVAYDYPSTWLTERTQPEQGLHLETGSPTRTTSSPIYMTPPRNEELLAWRGPLAPVTVAGGEEESSTATAPTSNTPSSDPAKRVLNFTTSLHTNQSCFHSVKGQQRRGLLIDPGAAAGLIGSETLRDLLDTCYKDKADHVSWSESEATITGISGCPDKALIKVHLRLPCPHLEASYTADVIGGEGSRCPALVGNPALCATHASLHSCWFDNRDGLLTTWDTSSKKPSLHMFRVLLTDSNHYLLPLDEDTSCAEAIKDVCHFMDNISQASRQRWPDHSYVFWQHMISAADPELKRSSDVSVRDTSKSKKVHFDIPETPCD